MLWAFGVIVIVFAVAVGAFFFFRSYKKRLAANVDDDTTNPDLDTAVDMLPFKKIWTISPEFAVTDLGEGQYRAYLKVGSLNYKLESNTGQNVIEANIRAVINSYPYPWMWHTQTHNIDPRERWKLLEKDVSDTLKSLRGTPSFDLVRKYFYDYKQNQAKTNMQNIINGTVKKEVRKYIIIPFGPDKLDPGLNEDQAFAESMQQISERVDLFRQLLQEMKLPSAFLNREQIIQLYTSEYNRENNLFSEGISDGTFTSVYADVPEEKYYLDDLHDADRLHLVLNRAQNSIQTGILRLDNIDPEVEKQAKEISNYIDQKLKEMNFKE